MNRKKLPNDRNGFNHRVTIDGRKIYFTVNCFEDGQPGELFIHAIEDPLGRIDDGGALLGFAEQWAIAVSLLLQLGMPFMDIYTKFAHSRFAPEGLTDNKTIRFASSIPDYIMEFMKERYANEERNDSNTGNSRRSH